MVAAYDHSGKQYGAVAIGARDPKTGIYPVTWLCCGMGASKTQTQILHYHNCNPKQCKECRDAGKEPFDPTPEGAVNVPGWGRLLPMGRMGFRYG